MPAIQLARLNIQVNELVEFVSQPDEFLRALYELLNFYADRTRRPGQSGRSRLLIPSYQVPRQVLRRIEGQLLPFVSGNSEAAFALADGLWQEDWFETRMLAIFIIGNVRVDDFVPIVNRLEQWGGMCSEDVILDALWQVGAQKILDQSPDTYLEIVQRWLEPTQEDLRGAGLRALLPLIQERSFENLPVLYRILRPYVQEASSSLETDLLQVMRALGQRSPQETAYFLERTIQGPHEAGASWIARQCLDVFPPDLEEVLREALRVEMHQRADDY